MEPELVDISTRVSSPAQRPQWQHLLYCEGEKWGAPDLVGETSYGIYHSLSFALLFLFFRQCKGWNGQKLESKCCGREHFPYVVSGSAQWWCCEHDGYPE